MPLELSHPDDPSPLADWIRDHIRQAMRDQAERLELEARIFVRMGFSPGELCMVDPREGPEQVHVVPRMMMESP